MSQALRKMTGTISKTNTICIFINQLRDKIGVMYGNPETTTGGNALKFYASVRLDVRRSITADNLVKEGGEDVGNLTKVKVIKNKVAPPLKKAEFDITWGEGINKVLEVIDNANEQGILKKWGKQITYKDNKYTLEEFTDLVKDNPEFYETIRKEIIANIIAKRK
jgi:recombination protein RecA